jgi:ADP-heptose:LPS heptosyltransferase
MRPISPKKILAIKLRALGDTVLMTASLDELRTAWPQAEIHVVVNSKWAPLLEGHPAIDRLWPCEWRNEKTARTRAVARLAVQLRKESFDYCLNFHASPSSAALAFGTGARVRAIHRHGSQTGSRFGTVTIPGTHLHKSVLDRDMDTLRALGLHVAPGSLPKIHLSSNDLQKGRVLLQETTSGANGPWLGLGLGASRESKSWPLERFAALAIDWCSNTGESAGCVAFLSEAETGIQHQFLKRVDEELAFRPDLSHEARTSLRGRITAVTHLSVRQLATALANCKVFAANDAGPRHIAAAVGTRTLTFFGPEDPFDWHPYPLDRHPRIYQAGLACRPPLGEGLPPWCGLEKCEEQLHRCMRDIGVDAALKQVLTLASAEVGDQ